MRNEYFLDIVLVVGVCVLIASVFSAFQSSLADAGSADIEAMAQILAWQPWVIGVLWLFVLYACFRMVRYGSVELFVVTSIIAIAVTIGFSVTEKALSEHVSGLIVHSSAVPV